MVGVRVTVALGLGVRVMVGDDVKVGVGVCVAVVVGVKACVADGWTGVLCSQATSTDTASKASIIILRELLPGGGIKRGNGKE
jgi:hypothetical protein